VIRVTSRGESREFSPGVTAGEVLAGSDAVAARIDGRLADLTTRLESDSTVEPVAFSTEEGRSIFWHSSAHLMAQAVKQLFPDAKVAIGPAVPEGFYYDFDVARPFTDDDLARIEKRMKELVKQRLPVLHRWLPRAEAIELFRARGEDYKVEIVTGLPDEQVSVYEQGDFVDLCRGPHVANTSVIRAPKLLSVAGAYWHGDEHNRMLSRIYGVAFPDRDQLKAHLDRLEEARRRDHRKLGVALDLFSMHEEAGAGLVFWHPRGAIVRRLIQEYWDREHLAAGYQLVLTPHIAHSRLWQRSGHFEHYRENMYVIPVDNEEYVLKPMNCPGHIMIYRAKVHSYRDLPVRMGEWGTVYRYERSGTLHGTMRVRGFTQDDAHLFCTAGQIEDELFGVVTLSLKMLRAFGFDRFRIDLSVRDPQHPEHYLGDDDQWQLAEGALVRTLERVGLPYRRAEGEAVFYGPKIDIKLLDSLDREWQCSTCQFDFNLASRFDVYYMGEDGRHHPAYLIHRTVLGGIERFFGILIEHYGGAFPTWLAPVQARVMCITDAQAEYAGAVAARLREAKVRVEIDTRSDKIGYKIAEAERMKVPFMLIAGAREAVDGLVSVRRQGREDLGAMSVDRALSLIAEESDVPR
jgi:threonyl-tRNA synthetase